MSKVNIGLWTLQVFLGVFFIAGSGAPKLLIPTESLPMPIPLASEFVHCIGLCEVLGGIGLILPGVVRIQTRFTPLAALGLVLLTICASTYQLLAHQPESAVFAAVMSVLCTVVAYGRGRVSPLRNAARNASAVQLAS